MVCVLNRTGRARLLACTACGVLATCERCDAAVAQPEDALVCGRCATSRPAVCLNCHSTRFKNLRAGVTRVREELEALAGETVVDVSGPAALDGTEPSARVIVGTEAALHRVTETDVVAFLDFDQELLAPRYRASEEAFALLARAARLVGGRRTGARVLVQTRVPDHEVIDAALHGDPSRVSAAERARRTDLRFPPFSAMAAVSGAGAASLIDAVAGLDVIGLDVIGLGVEVLGPAKGVWLVRADTHEALSDAMLRAAAADRTCARRSRSSADLTVSLSAWLRTRSGSSATRC